MPPSFSRPWGITPVSEPLLLPDGRHLGCGFVHHIPGGLPSCAREAYINLAWVDYALAQCRLRVQNDRESDALRCLINDAQHRVMSVTEWRDISDQAAAKYDAGFYECARLCVVIYSCAVVFSYPTRDRWHIKLCRRLQLVMQLSAISQWPDGATPFLVWCLMVANMAAFQYEQRTYFQDALRTVLRKHKLGCWSEVRIMLLDFVWSDSACAKGAMWVWDRVAPDPPPSE